MTIPITIEGNIFIRAGQCWSPIGLAYQPTGGVDPLSDDRLGEIEELLAPDGDFTRLGINCLRVYQVEPDKPHDRVFARLAEAGIYVLVGAVNATTAIRRDQVDYPVHTKVRCVQVLDAFSRYDNVLGFSIANELLDSPGSQQHGLPALVKALARDLKIHQAEAGLRAIPIGMAMRDDPTYTFPAADFYTCGPAAERVDFLGYNCYRWSGPRAGNVQAYLGIFDQFQNYPVPVVFAEYGAQQAGTSSRPWDQVPFLFGAERLASNGRDESLADAISGGIAFRYLNKNEMLGLVQAPGQPTSFGGFDALADQYGQVNEFPPVTGALRQVACDALGGNPYVRPLPVGPSQGNPLPADISVTVTNEYRDPPRQIRINILMQGASEFQQVAELPPSGPSRSVTLPGGTVEVSIIYLADDGQWYQGCKLLSVGDILSDGSVLVGQWIAPNGNGNCMIR